MLISKFPGVQNRLGNFNKILDLVLLYDRDWTGVHAPHALIPRASHGRYLVADLDPGLPRHYRVFEGSPQFQQIYLDELNKASDLSLGLRLLRLIDLEPDATPEKTIG